MFLINSSVGSFAAAPTSLDIKGLRSKIHTLFRMLVSQKIRFVIKNVLFNRDIH